MITSVQRGVGSSHRNGNAQSFSDSEFNRALGRVAEISHFSKIQRLFPTFGNELQSSHES